MASLSNPAFGEKLSVHWLDLVRYADTVGYHGDQLYTVWPFRVTRSMHSTKTCLLISSQKNK